MLYVKEIELKFRKRPAKGIEGSQISTPEDVYRLVQDIKDDVVEKMIALHLNNRNVVNCLQKVAVGSINSAPASASEILRVSLLTGSIGVILIHNHPSGDTSPSEEDKTFTRRMKEACTLLDIKFLDHIIVGDSGFFSFTTQNMF